MARIVEPAEDIAAARRYLTRNTAGTLRSELTLHSAFMLKWAAMALAPFDLVLFADLDVALNPTDLSSAVWRASTDAFMRSAALFVGSQDRSSPVNTGVWLAKPRPWVHREGLRVMAECNFSKERGLCDVGSPRELSTRHGARILRQLAAGFGVPDASAAVASATAGPSRRSGRPRRGGEKLSTVRSRFHGTEYMRADHWRFVGGREDQGLFWTVVYVLLGVGTWAAPDTRWKVDHYWSRPKPWEPIGAEGRNLGRAVRYLSQWDQSTAGRRSSGACARQLARLSRRARALVASRVNATGAAREAGFNATSYEAKLVQYLARRHSEKFPVLPDARTVGSFVATANGNAARSRGGLLG